MGTREEAGLSLRDDSDVDLAEVDASSLMLATGDYTIDLRWEKVNYSVPIAKTKEAKQILFDCAGDAKPGEIIAIMGASGSGKTTLLNVLAGRLKCGQVTGDIRANNRQRGYFWRHLIGYVEQNDIMYADLTVKETLTYAALLRLPKKMSREQKLQRVESVIASLGLKAVEDSKIGGDMTRGVSGGEKKRVAIGIDLVTDPKLLFLDEPTSGLDAFTAQYLIETLRDLCKNDKKTIITTIHQPRSKIFNMFDKVLLLSQGKVVYFGPPAAALEYFGNMGYPCPNLENPADHYLDITAIDYRTPESAQSTKERTAAFRAAWAAKETTFMKTPEPNAAAQAKKPRKTSRISILTEVKILLERNFLLQWRDKRNLIGTIIQNIILALFFGFVFFQVSDNQAGVQNRIGILFLIIINYTFSTVMPILIVFPIEKLIIIRERYASSYRSFSVYFAKAISLLPLRFILITITGSFLYWVIGLNPIAGRFFIFLLILFDLLFTCISLALMLGAAVPDVLTAQIVGPLILVIFIIFGGGFANSQSVTWILRWIEYLSVIFYTYNAMAINEFTDLTFTCNNQEVCNPGFTNGNQVLAAYGITFPITAGLLITLGLGLVFQVFGYIFLKYTTRPRMILV